MRGVQKNNTIYNYDGQCHMGIIYEYNVKCKNRLKYLQEKKEEKGMGLTTD